MCTIQEKKKSMDLKVFYDSDSFGIVIFKSNYLALLPEIEWRYSIIDLFVIHNLQKNI